MSSEIQQLREEVAALRGDIQVLLDAWRTAKGVVTFVKWLGGVATAVTAMWTLIKVGKG